MVAAAESREPVRAVARMSTAVMTRIMLFYVGSILLIVTVVPWQQIVPGQVAVRRRHERDALQLGQHGDDSDHPDRRAVLPESAFYVTSRVLFALAPRAMRPPRW